jgi:hypothetical protein
VQEALWTVSVDDSGFQGTDHKSEKMAVSLADLMGVAIETNDSGPWGADVWWLLFGADGKLACAFPQGASGDEAVIDRLTRLPGFDHEKMMDAMCSTGNALFSVWRR